MFKNFMCVHTRGDKRVKKNFPLKNSNIQTFISHSLSPFEYYVNKEKKA